MTDDDQQTATEHGGKPSSAHGSSHGRLWTPWRMRYVAGGAREDGCIFCNRLAEDDDARALILHRGERAFVIMNLFPYNTGHVMIVPYAHVASPEDADAETVGEMAALRGPLLTALRRALSPAGFNLGLNVGSVAGAGVSDHLHEHVVPRWEGDANFMPILASTMVMPELIPVTYAKLRAELARELGGGDRAVCIVLTDDQSRVLVDSHGALPRVDAEEGEPLWRAALRAIRGWGADNAEIVAWGGNRRASGSPIALVTRATIAAPDSGVGAPSQARIEEALDGPDSDLLSKAVDWAGSLGGSSEQA